MKRSLLSMLMALVAIMMPIGAWAVDYTFKMNKTGVATLYLPFTFQLPEGLRAYFVKDVVVNEDGTVQLVEQEITNVVPALTPVIIRGSEGSYGLPVLTEAEPVELEGTNLLKGTLVIMPLDVDNGTTNYLLNCENWDNMEAWADWQAPKINGTTVFELPANQAYLQLDSSLAGLKPLPHQHLQHTHGGCEICGQVTVVEAAWGTSAADLTSYGTLAEAVAADGEEGSTIGYIKLLADVEYENGIYIEGGNFTLDLNGHTISSDIHSLCIQNNSNVTIEDNSSEKSGKVISSGEGCVTVFVDGGASVTIEEGTYESANHYVLYVQGDKSSVTINGGSYRSSLIPVEIHKGCSATIAGGTFEYADYGAIKNYGNLVVKGGTFTYNGESFDATCSTIDYFGGSIDFSDYPTTEDISSIIVSNRFEMDIVPGAETILLPEGYCFFEVEKGTPVTMLVQNWYYYIGEEPAKYTIAFNAGDGEGEMEGEIIYEGNYTLPECTFTAPEGMVFKAWQVGEDEENLYQPGEEITVTADTEIKAVWTVVPQIVIKMSDSGENGWEGASITVKKDGVELDETVTIEDGTEATVTLVYDLDSRYTFYWNMGQDGGNSDGECEFEIIVNGETVYTSLGSDFSDDIEFFFALGDPFVVSFNANDGSGSMDDIETYESVTLPECTFTAPEGMMFKAWQIGEEEYQPGDDVTIEDNTTITALWTAYVPQIVIKMHDSANDGWHGDAIVVKKNGKEIGIATIEEDGGADGIVCYEYDKRADYTFYWQYTEQEYRYPEECSFEIFIDDEEVFAAVRNEEENTSDCVNYEDGELLYSKEGEDAVLENLTIADGEQTEYINDASFTTVGTLTYTRTLPNLKWNALYVPFEIPVSALTDKYDVAYINDVHSYDTDDDGEIDDLQMEVIKITTGKLKANYPYLIRAKNVDAKEMNLELTDATLRATEENTVTCTSVFMQFDVTGTYNIMSQEDNPEILAISTDGAWKKLAEDTALKPFRLYLTLTALDGSPVVVEEEALTRMRIVTRGEEGDVTGIEDAQFTIDNSEMKIYDLSGRRVKTPAKGGVYIINGKKVVF